MTSATPLTAVIGFIGTVIYTWGLVYFDCSFLPRTAPDLAPRRGKSSAGPASRVLLILAAAAYGVLAVLYLAALMR